MTRGSALLSVAALFFSGVTIGALGMFLYVDGRPGERPRGPFPAPPPRFAMETMADALGLTPEQRAELEEIHRESRRAAEEIRREMKPRLEDHIAQTRERMMAVLPPGQRERFEERRARFGGRMDRFLLGEGRAGGPRRGPPRRGGPRRDFAPPPKPATPPPDEDQELTPGAAAGSR